MLTKISENIWINIDEIVVFENNDRSFLRFRSSPRDDFKLEKQDADQLAKILIEYEMGY